MGTIQPETTTPFRLQNVRPIKNAMLHSAHPQTMCTRIRKSLSRLAQVDDGRYHHLPAPTEIKRYGLLWWRLAYARVLNVEVLLTGRHRVLLAVQR